MVSFCAALFLKNELFLIRAKVEFYAVLSTAHHGRGNISAAIVRPQSAHLAFRLFSSIIFNVATVLVDGIWEKPTKIIRQRYIKAAVVLSQTYDVISTMHGLL